MSKSNVLTVPTWNTSEVKFMAPKINDKGGKSINIISTKTNRSLTISTPLMMTWGIADFQDEKGEGDGKFSISLNFPNDEYSNTSTDLFLNKLKEFECQLLDDAIKNSELWFGKTLTPEVIKYMFFPILKYSKNKETKQTDYSKPPSIRAKVPNYNGKWNIEIYDTSMNMIFPADDIQLTPMDFVPKLSNVACVLGISQVWTGGKGWGCTIKLIQCIVKPREIGSAQGKCNIQLFEEDKAILDEDSESYIDYAESHCDPTSGKCDIPAPDLRISLVPQVNSTPTVFQTQLSDTTTHGLQPNAFTSPPPSKESPPPVPFNILSNPSTNVHDSDDEIATTPLHVVPEPPKRKIVKKKVT